ncbi:hybrid sensor histidine kinase/response regulator [Haloarcula marina]|uniref:hybrid sensor histidine kinase/response regulator n=1 Tax=Haloarcula marina TaxID=2961574 RepID=UPI0020B64915|nr:ATP-binding protein [Halomicroarcula marina]
MGWEWPPREWDEQIRVLHVDDNSDFLDVATAMLARQADELNVVPVDDPASVTDRLSEARVDCIVSDYDMTPLDGLELLRTVRDEYPDLPFILFTGKGSEEVASEAISAGVTDYVQKSGDNETFEMLYNRIENAVDHARTEQRLAYQSSLLDTIFERIPHHMYVKDAEGRHLRVSEAHVDDPAAVIGKTDTEMYPEIHAEDTYRDDMQVIEEGDPIIHKEEQTIAEVSKTYSFDNLYDNYEKDVVTDKQRYNEWVLTSKVPWRDEDGDIVGLIGITLDISDQKHYEQSLERHTERLEQFLAEVAHDVRSPLQVASANAALLRDDVDGDDARDRLDAIERNHDRIAALADELANFARHGDVEPTPEPVDLNEMVADAWASHATDEATLTVGDLPTVEADRTELRRLVDNLVDNAIDHAGTEAAVTVGPIDGGGFYVADDGPGVPADERATVFETGYTTAADGTGLGLAIVDTVADRHDWTVSVTDSEDGGARFEIHV